MGSFSLDLYNDLMKICSSHGEFYLKDLHLDGLVYRVFNYRLCSFDQFWLNVNALNCRGTMFEISDQENVRLVSLPPSKFFNYEEGDGMKKHPQGRVNLQMEKRDGSLISTFVHSNAQVRFKSKTSLQSSQAQQATQLFTGDLREEIEKVVHLEYTVNLEYTSPSNQIVVRYPRSQLTILSIRSHRTGQSLYADALLSFLEENRCPTMIEHLVSYRTIVTETNQVELINQIRQETEGEGYVLEILLPGEEQQPYLVKVKNLKYLLLHQARSDLDNPKRLFHCIINEQTDDLRALIANEDESLQRLTRMEEQIRPKFNRMVQSIEQYFQDNRHLSRKEFALQITKDQQMRVFLSLLMNLYSGRENDYKAFALHHGKDLFQIDQLDTQNVATDIDREE